MIKFCVSKIKIFGLLLIGTYLVGCQSIPTLADFSYHCSNGNLSCFKSLSKIANTPVPPLNHQFSYIKLSLNGQVAWVAKGATEKWFQPNTDVYYSANGSVFRWRNGRLVGVQVENLIWREIDSPHIDWLNLLKNPQSQVSFYRTVDNIDGVLSKKELRHLRQIHSPHQHAFSGNANHLVWFHEYGPLTTNPQKPTSYDIWFAIDPNQPTEPIYAQQCFSVDMCVIWQKW